MNSLLWVIDGEGGGGGDSLQRARFGVALKKKKKTKKIKNELFSLSVLLCNTYCNHRYKNSSKICFRSRIKSETFYTCGFGYKYRSRFEEMLDFMYYTCVLSNSCYRYLIAISFRLGLLSWRFATNKIIETNTHFYSYI